jgi:predicted lipoprotein with Yx(FWY)xxD motif
MTPPPPREFTVQDTTIGQVLSDAHGMTIYVYQCGDEARQSG